MKPSFFSKSNIKRNVFAHINFKVLGLILLLFFIGAFIVVFIFKLENSDFADFGGIIFWFAIGFYLLKTKIKFNNYCPKCNTNHCFYGDINSKTTQQSSSTSDVIYERNTGKRIGYFQSGTSVDGAKYEIRTETSTSNTNFYDWVCSNCSYKVNLEESQSSLYYIIIVLFSFVGIIYYGYKTVGVELYNNYKQKQQDKEIELLLKSNSNTELNNENTTESKTLTDTSQTKPSDFNESDYAARYSIGSLNLTKAKFIGYEEGDLVHYVFEDEKGNTYGFSIVPSKYSLLITDNSSIYGMSPNPKYLNKNFSLAWKAFEPKYNEEMEYPFQAVLTIQLLDE